MKDALCGLIESRLKYINDPKIVEDVIDGVEEISINDEVDMDFFLTCHYDKNDKAKCELIKRNLRKIVEERMRLLKNNPQLDLKIQFPCMLLNLELVSV